MSKTIWLGAVAYNPKVVTIWEGMRRYFHEEAHLSVDVRTVSELRVAGSRAPRPTGRGHAAYRYRLEHKSCLPSGR